MTRRPIALELFERIPATASLGNTPDEEDYPAAAKTYATVVEKYPDSSFAPYALLGKGWAELKGVPGEWRLYASQTSRQPAVA